jgi:hypothetical protein
VGEKLNVANVLEGSLQRQGNHVRVTAELVDTRNGFRVWTETYDRQLDGAFALQDQIARSIADALKIKFAVRLSAQEQPGNGVHDSYLQGLFTNVSHPTGASGIGPGVAVQNSSDSFTVSDYTSPEDFDPRRPDTRVAAVPLATEFTSSVGDRASEAGPRTNKITADVIAAPPEMAFNTGVREHALQTALRTNTITADVPAAPSETALNTNIRDRPSEVSLRTNKITADVTAAPPETAPNTSVRDRASEAGLRTNKITADGPVSLQGFVKDAKGEPIKGADVRVESRSGKELFSTVKTDTQGRYISQGLQPGVYRVTLLVSGVIKASIMNTQTKANQPTQLNFDLKTTSQAGNIAKSGKHIVWMPGRTGTHLGGNWVEVDDKGNEQSGSKTQTYTARRW